MNNGKQNKSQGKLAKLLLVSYNMRRASYIIRGLAGVYLVYLMYQMFSESGKSGEQLSVFLITVGVIRTIAGIYFAIGAVYALVNGIFEENVPAQPEELNAELPETESEEVVAEAVAEITEETET